MRVPTAAAAMRWRARKRAVASPIRHPDGLRPVLLIGSLLSLMVAGAVRAQLTGGVALLSDYRYRGESLTQGEPAVQGSLDYQHASGIFLGALVSNVRIENMSGLAAQLYGGYARALSQDWSVEAGLDTNLYPHPSYGSNYDYTEAFIGASYQSINARAYYSGNYLGGGHAAYFELNASRPLGERLVLFGHVGYLAEHEPRQLAYRGQDRPFFDGRIGVSIEVFKFRLELSVTGTTATQAACPVGRGQCGTAGVVAISRSF